MKIYYKFYHLHETPRYSVNKLVNKTALAPFAAVNESPIAPTTLISVGLTWFTLVGFDAEADKALTSQGNEREWSLV